jgi:isopenicillin N synthase-like dioxygenase
MATILDSVASVSLTAIGPRPDSFAAAIGGSFERYGFAVVADHGIPADLIARAEDKARAFFALPEEVKRRYHVAGGGGARGYTPFGIETAKGATAYDLKEFWHVGRELPPGHPFEPMMPRNAWPEEVESFRATFLELFAAFDRAGARILEAIARHLRPRARFLRRHGARRQFGAAPAPLPAGARRRPQRPRRRA